MYHKIPMLLTLNLFIKLKTLINHAHKWFLKVCNGFEINIHIKMYFNGLNCSRVLSTSLRLRTSSITLYVPHILCTHNSGSTVYMLEINLPSCLLVVVSRVIQIASILSPKTEVPPCVHRSLGWYRVKATTTKNYTLRESGF